jgi:hypothetical protein
MGERDGIGKLPQHERVVLAPVNREGGVALWVKPSPTIEQARRERERRLDEVATRVPGGVLVNGRLGHVWVGPSPKPLPDGVDIMADDPLDALREALAEYDNWDGSPLSAEALAEAVRAFLGEEE